MNIRILWATLAGGIVSFLLGWLVFGFLLEPYFAEHVVDHPGLFRKGDDFRMSGILLVQFLNAALLAFVFDRWGSVQTFRQGLAGGIVIGFLMQSIFDVYFWSTMNLYPAKVYVVDVIVNTAFNGVIGGVVASVLGWKKS
jgi:hypothetical protein